jgi:hypothetical protein
VPNLISHPPPAPPIKGGELKADDNLFLLALLTFGEMVDAFLFKASSKDKTQR